MEVTLPYGQESVSFQIPDASFSGRLDPPTTVFAASDPIAEIERAIDEPFGSSRLEELVHPGQKVAIIADDASRPTPVHKILPVVIRRLEKAGILRSDIRIVMALGSHRYMTEEEMRARVGDEIYESYEVINSEFRDPEKLVYVGKTPEGVDILATKAIMESDVRIGVGNLVPHPVMGWGGGGKILYPGVAGEDTVAYFHLKAALIDENMFGDSTTPIRDMMESWVDTIGLDFVINTVLTPQLEICKVVAGNYIAAHRAGVEIGKKALGCRVEEKVDVVVVSSHPADQDFWQSPKAMYAAEHALKGTRGGTMILVSPNYEGIGPHREYPVFMGRDDGDEVVRECIRTGKAPGDPLAIAVGNSMSKMRRRRKLVVVGDGVTAEEMAQCGCVHYPLGQLQRAVDDALAEYPNCRVAAMANGAETFLYE